MRWALIPANVRSTIRTRADPARFDAQVEQRHASETGSLPEVVADELSLMDRADLLVLQYPMWWHLPPAMLKGWFDRVLAYGAVYTSKRRFENGRFAGKRAMVSVTVGTTAAPYEHDGRSGDIDLLLWPVNFTLAYVGYEMLAPYVAYGVEAGLRYSDPGCGRRAAEGDRRRLPRRRAALLRARADPLQPHGGMGAGRPHRSGGAGPFAVHPAKEAARPGVTRPALIAKGGSLGSDICGFHSLGVGGLPMQKEEGIVKIPSHHSVDETVDRLKTILKSKGVTLFALVDHSGEAENVGLKMPPTKLLIFGSPKGGTPLMLASPSAALDLPLKILVAEDFARQGVDLLQQRRIPEGTARPAAESLVEHRHLANARRSGRRRIARRPRSRAPVGAFSAN